MPSEASIMLKIFSVALVATAMFLGPATAQQTKPMAADQKQCADQFKAADLNNDGVLSRTEIGNAQQTLPASLANKDRVTRVQFMAVCSKNAS
jgi:hypothetical protein